MCKQELSTVSDIVCIWMLWAGSEYSVWYCCVHLTVVGRERVQCVILLCAFDSCGQGASTVCDIVVCIWQLWAGSEYSVWYCCVHLTVVYRERVQCVILLYAFDSYGQGASTVCDIVVCIWLLWAGSKHSVWYCCTHLTVMGRERVKCLILLYAFESYEQGASTVGDIVVCIWLLWAGSK